MAKFGILGAGTRTKWSGRRHIVNREERIGPTPETAAKLQPWAWRELQQVGTISVQQFEAGQQIVKAYSFITGLVGFKPTDLGHIGSTHGTIGQRGERTIAIYVRWGNGIQGIDPTAPHDIRKIEEARRRSLGIRPHVVYEFIVQQDENRRAIGYDIVPVLAKACTRWIETSEDYDREHSVEKERHTIMTAGALASASV